MRVGFAGLGQMGAHMARNLARAGFAATVWNRTEGKARTLSDEVGCAVAPTPCALAKKSDVIITRLADDALSEDVHFGPDGIFAADNPALQVIEMGTMSPDYIAALVNAAPLTITVIDDLVSGAMQAAQDAQLMIIAGYTQADATPLLPLLDALGKQTVFLDRSRAEAVMKLAVNALIHGQNRTVAKALTVVETAGIATQTAFDMIEASAAAAPMLSYRRPLYLYEAAHDITFTVALARKDMEVTVALAHQLGVALPQARETLARLQDAKARDTAATPDYMRLEMQ